MKSSLFSYRAKNTKPPSSRGFTVLELMVATSVFAVILLVITAGVISFTGYYFKSITSTRTQSTARSIMSEISQSIQFGQKVVPPNGSAGVNLLCIDDNTVYAFKLGVMISASQPGLERGGTCNNPPDWPSDGTELLGDHMRLGVLSVTSVGQNTWRVHVRVLYGDDDLFSSSDWTTANCKSGNASRFCAVADLTTAVQQRVVKRD